MWEYIRALGEEVEEYAAKVDEIQSNVQILDEFFDRVGGGRNLLDRINDLRLLAESAGDKACCIQVRIAGILNAEPDGRARENVFDVGADVVLETNTPAKPVENDVDAEDTLEAMLEVARGLDECLDKLDGAIDEKFELNEAVPSAKKLYSAKRKLIDKGNIDALTTVWFIIASIERRLNLVNSQLDFRYDFIAADGQGDAE